MPRPWSDPVVWKRGVTLLGLMLLIALGLCGLNYTAYRGVSRHTSVTSTEAAAQAILTFTGIAEDFGMLLGALGLLTSLIGLLLSTLLRRNLNP